MIVRSETSLGREMLKYEREQGHRPCLPPKARRKGDVSDTAEKLLRMARQTGGVVLCEELADDLGIEHVSIYSQVTRMVTRGFIERRVVGKQTNGQKLVRLYATEAGRRAIGAAQ